MKIYHLILIFVILIVGLVTADLILKEPTIWPDESVFADQAFQMVEQNKLFLIYWYTPLLYYLLFFWFKLFGFSILVQRLLSVFFSGLFLVVFYQFVKLILQERLAKHQGLLVWIASLCTAALLLDFTFIKSTRLSRPEIFLMFFGLTSLYFFIKLLTENKTKPTKILWLFLSISSFLLALSAHLISIYLLFVLLVSFFLYSRVTKEKIHSKILIILPGLTVALASFIVIANYLKDRVLNRLVVAGTQESWIITVFNTQPLELKLIYLIYLLTTVIFIVYSLKCHHKKYLILSSLLLFAWLAAIAGKMFWYYVLPLPFIYLALFTLVTEAYLKLKELQIKLFKILFIIFLIFLTGLLFSNLKLSYYMFLLLGGDNYSYELYTSQIQQIIPPNKTVFLSAIPDPFYALIIKSRRNQYIPFTATKIEPEVYYQVLDEADYIIYNGSYDSAYMGDFLNEYIDKNNQKITQIGGPSQYVAWIIELKPKGQRVLP